MLSDKSKSYILDVTENLFKATLADLIEISICLDLNIECHYVNLYNDEQLKMRILYDVVNAIQNNIINVYKLIALEQSQKGAK